MNELPLLTLITLVPFVGGILLAGIDAHRATLARRLALIFSLIPLGIALCLWGNFDPAETEMQFVEQHNWIPTLGVEYFLGIDGLGLLMVLLTALVVPFAVFASNNISERVPIYYALMLFLQAGLFGTFTALNFFHWFLFWEISLIPAFFLIKLWGGPNRSAAAIHFFIYTMVGSVAMLLAFLAIYQATGTFDFLRLTELARSGELTSLLSVKLGWYDLSANKLSVIIFSGVFLGLAVKVPLVPFHTWLPATYAEAPTPVSILLTGLMSKMGIYGLLRILLPIFPEQMRLVLTPLLWLVLATIVWSAFAALAQKDLKRLLGYSSINHLGYCVLGVLVTVKLTYGEHAATDRAAALNGVLLQMFNHGITAAALFCFVGFLEQRSGGLRGLDDFGGLRKVAPIFCGLIGIALFSSLGLPGLNGFIGEFLIFKGAFALVGWTAVLATPGILLTAVFILGILQRVFSGPLNPRWAELPDLTWHERLLVTPFIVLMFVIGIYPQIIIEFINPTVMSWVEHLRF